MTGQSRARHEAAAYKTGASSGRGAHDSLRGVGYPAATALADLIDNSIFAGASTVWLAFNFEGPKSSITVLDDGCGLRTNFGAQ